MIEKVLRNCEYLLNILDTNKYDRIITFTEWKDSKVGKDSDKGWSDFKNKFISDQKHLGFIWKKVQGLSKPFALELTNVELSSEIGEELSKLIYEENSKSGHFINDVLKPKLKPLFDYLGDEFCNSNLNYIKAKEGFKSTVNDNKVYKFSRHAGMVFTLSIYEYKYFKKGGNEKDVEFDFVEFITNSSIGKSFFYDSLRLSFFEHVQENRNSGKSQNVDLQGFKIKKTMDEDSFQMFNFVLRSSNGIGKISKVISQAINNKEKANFTYIIIPNFDHEAFSDPERFNGYHDICKKNQIGIISVRMNLETDLIEDIIEMIRAEQTEIYDFSDLRKMVDEQDYEKCPVCRKIVKTNDRQGCGWRMIYQDSEGKEQVGCMKEEWSNTVIKSISTQKQ